MNKKSQKTIFFVVYFILSSIFFIYVVLPAPAFPDPLPDVLQSKEPADLETPLRRGYFTNATRGEVMEYYLTQFRGYRLNYPPEESGTIIRDQTHSTFLEEIVHPFRESIYISGYEPKGTNKEINVEGLFWRQKVIVKYVPSSLIIRIIVCLLIVVSWPVVIREWFKRND